jgi:ATP-binding cassette subfamily F protein uup
VSLVSLQQVTKLVSGRTLFEGITFVLTEGERLALIGPNGAGKSTLLKIVAGLIEPDEGQITTKRGLRVAYVPQQEEFDTGKSVRELLEEVLVGIDQNDRDGRIARTLGLTGFNQGSILAETLSGGWKKRLSIARGLVQEPELLLLDEPTNHLDIDGIEWLEQLLNNIRCSVAFISHDRYFLESAAKRVIELDRRYPGGFLSVNGNYSEFLARRSEYYEQRQQQQDSLANKVRREVEWLRQGAKARTTKSKHRTEEANRLISELKSIDLATRKPRLEFLGGAKQSKELLKVEDLEFSRGGKVLGSELSFLLSRGVRLGIVGPNGSGKSSLIKIILGENQPDAGKVLRASNLKIAVFDQARTSLNPEQSLEEALIGDGKSFVWNGVEYTAIAWGRRFLFRPEQLSLPIKRLSGGEQARVLISKLMRTPADILILDEPTNDLDIPTLEVLEESIDEFPGAVVLVTHDRYLLDRVSTQVVGLSGDGVSEVFASYLQWEMAREARSQQQRGRAKRSPQATGSDSPRSRAGLSFTEQHELAGMEKAIEVAEKQLSTIEQALGAPEAAMDQEMLTRLCDELAIAQAEVDRLYARWDELEKKKS